MQIEAASCLEDLAGHIVANQRRKLACSGQQAWQIHPSVVAHQRQGVHHFFGADIARCTGRIGAAPDTAKRGVKAVSTGVDGRDHIGQAHATRVVEMQGQLGSGPTRTKCLGQLRHLGGISHAGGVAQGHAARAQLLDVSAAPLQHHWHRHVAFHGAAKGARQRHVDGHTRALHRFDDIGQPCIGLFARHAQIRQVVAFAGRHDQVKFVRFGFDGPLRTTHIGHQGGVNHARHTTDFSQHLLGIAQCWNGFGRYERRDLDLGQTGIRQGVDQGDLVFGRHKSRFGLQTVAGADFLHVDAAPCPLPKVIVLVHATTFLSRNCLICSALMPSSVSTASVSSPSLGAEDLT